MKGIGESQRHPPGKQEQTGMVVLLVVAGVLGLSALMLSVAHDRAHAVLERFEPDQPRVSGRDQEVGEYKNFAYVRRFTFRVAGVVLTVEKIVNLLQYAMHSESRTASSGATQFAVRCLSCRGGLCVRTRASMDLR